MVSQCQKGETVLTKYLKENSKDLKTIKKLTEKGADINQPNLQGETPLKLALDQTTYRRNQLKALLNEADGRYAGAISSLRKNIFVYDLSMDMIKLGANPEKVFTNEGLTFLGDKLTYLDIDSCDFYYPKTLRSFLTTNHTKELYVPDLNGNTPLHLLMTPKKDLALLFLADLIYQHTDINAQNNQGDTALLYGLKQNAEESLLLSLIEKGTDIHQANQDGNTALHIAVQKKNMDQVILALLEKGANVSAKNKQGETPLTQATSPLVKRFLYCLQKISPKKREILLNEPLQTDLLKEKMPTKQLKVQQVSRQKVHFAKNKEQNKQKEE